MDRFLMRLTIGYPGEEAERRILMESTGVEPVLERVQPVLEPPQVLQLQEQVEDIHVDPSLVTYLMTVVRRTREDARLQLGVSPRGAIALFRAARAYALVDGRTYLTPDDIRGLVVPCLAHRLLPSGVSTATAEAHDEAAALLEELVDEIPAPV